MECERCVELLSAHLDGELSAEENRILDEHLEQCPECRELAAQLAALQDSFADMEETAAPEGFARGVMERIRAQEEIQPKVVPLFRRPQMKALAGLAACAVLSIGLFRGGMSSGDNFAAPEATSAGAASMATAETAYELDGYSLAKDASYQGSASASGTAAQADGTFDASTWESGVMERDPESYAFQNDRYIRVSWGQTPEAPSACILGSADSLADYAARFPENDLTEALSAYDAEYFAARRLLAVVVEEPSGSNRHAIRSLGREEVTILRIAPEAGDCDMAAWLILAEVDAMFDDGDTLAVCITD